MMRLKIKTILSFSFAREALAHCVVRQKASLSRTVLQQKRAGRELRGARCVMLRGPAGASLADAR